MEKGTFKQLIYAFYRQHKRSLPWRPPALKLRRDTNTLDPYAILVSEIMLQQTQVSRVIPKFQEWMREFPTIEQLGRAPARKVLLAWQGLGYNRRGLNLHRAAQQMVERFDGTVPRDGKDLLSLPGIGPYTASAVRAFAYNEPVVMIETNIRSVFLYHFFKNEEDVHDRELLRHIEATLDRENPREWYWALMDYGSHLKQTVGNANVKSRHYVRQSRFEGSRRQLRARILKHVLAAKTIAKQEIAESFPPGEWDAKEILDELIKEGFLVERGTRVTVQ